MRLHFVRGKKCGLADGTAKPRRRVGSRLSLLFVNSNPNQSMCLKKRKTEKDNATNIIGVGITLTIIILVIISWRYRNYTLCGSEIDANITSSYGTIISAFLTTLWSAIAVYIYYLALKVQSKELKTSQEVAFGQNLSFLISCSSTILSKLQLRGILKRDEVGYRACTFLFVGLKYCYEVMKQESISVIDNLENTKRKIEEAEANNTDREIDEMIEEREMELLAYNNPEQYFKVRKEDYFNKYKLDFQYLFMLSKSDLEWKNKENREYYHIQGAFNKVWGRYGHIVQPYFMSIENSINYLFEHGDSSVERKKYVPWITSNMSQTGIAFFYYYLYCRKEEKRDMIIRCQTLNFLKDLNKEQFLLDKSHYELRY